MAAAQTPVLVHLLDPVPGIVVTKIVEGLRALGMDAELRRGPRAPRRRVAERGQPPPGRWARSMVSTSLELSARDQIVTSSIRPAM